MGQQVIDERRWQILFMRWPVHWTGRWMTWRHPNYAHVLLISPIGNGQWLGVDWGVKGLFVRPLGSVAVAKLLLYASEVLEYDQFEAAAPDVIGRSILPQTCMTMARQAMGLPSSWAFWRSGWALRCELLERGARVVMPPKPEVPFDEFRRWWRRRQ